MPALVGLLGLRMRAAVGTSLLVITVNSLGALALRGGTCTNWTGRRSRPSSAPRSWARGTAERLSSK